MRSSILLVLIITTLIIPYSTLRANAASFPMCSPINPVQVFPTFMTGQEQKGAFGVAGCTFPPATMVQVYFTGDSNTAFLGLPGPSNPLSLFSRPDGHFHETFRFPPSQPADSIRVHAVVPGCCSYIYPFAWTRPYCQEICQSGSQGAAPFIYPAWALNGPPGAFTVFIDAIPSSEVGIAHVKVYFVNIQTRGSVTGLPSLDAPWTAQTLQGGTLRHSFIIQSDRGLDTTIYNIDAKMYIEETGKTIVFPIWVHKPTPPSWTNSSLQFQHENGTTRGSLLWSRAADPGGSGVYRYNIYVNGTLTSTTPALTQGLQGVSCGATYLFRVEATDYANNTSSSGPFIVTTLPALKTDVDRDCKVDISDLALVASHYGAKTGDPKYLPIADVNGDGVIDIRDLSMVVDSFGTMA